MMLAFPTSPKRRDEIVAAIHPQDGTARAHILDEAWNPGLLPRHPRVRAADRDRRRAQHLVQPARRAARRLRRGRRGHLRALGTAASGARALADLQEVGRESTMTSSDLAFTPATELAELIRAREALARGAHARRARPHRAPQPDRQRSSARSPPTRRARGGARGRAGGDEGRAARPAARRAVLHQGPALHPGHPDDVRVVSSSSIVFRTSTRR